MRLGEFEEKLKQLKFKSVMFLDGAGWAEAHFTAVFETTFRNVEVGCLQASGPKSEDPGTFFSIGDKGPFSKAEFKAELKRMFVGEGDEMLEDVRAEIDGIEEEE